MGQIFIGAFSQMLSLFGSIMVFGLLLQIISRFTTKVYVKPFGWKAIYFLAWLGTPIHELGHALFCLLFRHKIVGIKLFKPDKITGTLGYVRHTYNRGNLMAQIGNFFIGIGPLISGAVALFMLFYFLIPGGSETWSNLLATVRGITSQAQIPSGDYFRLFTGSAVEMFETIFRQPNIVNWRFWIYLYLSISIASHMGISLPDLKVTAKGLCFLLPVVYALFLLMNLLGMVTGWGGEYFMPILVSSFAVISGVLMLALSISLLGFTFSYLIIAPYVRLRRGYIIDPF